MTHQPPRNRVTRRQALAIGVTAASVPVAGCDTSTEGMSGDGGATPADQKGFRAFGDTLAAVSQPWSQTASEATDEMVADITSELDNLLRVSVGGRSTSALKAIIEATITAFEQLNAGRKAFQVELIRAEAKAVVAGNPDLKGKYPEGYSYSSAKPYEPLFLGLADGFLTVAQEDTEENRQTLREAGNAVSNVLWDGYLSGVRRHKGEAGADALIKSIEFLNESAEWAADF